MTLPLCAQRGGRKRILGCLNPVPPCRDLVGQQEWEWGGQLSPASGRGELGALETGRWVHDISLCLLSFLGLISRLVMGWGELQPMLPWFLGHSPCRGKPFLLTL